MGSPRTVLVTGATGMLGRYVHQLLQSRDVDVLAPGRLACDLSRPDAVYQFVVNANPSAILHLAAETDVDACERDPRHAGVLNHLATDAIARAAGSCGSWMLYISTSNVFGAECKLSYNELDLPSPVNYYGRSKLHGELAVRLRCPDRHLILRAGWMIGGGPERDHKFVGKVVRQIRDGARTIRAVTDKFGSLTPARLLAQFAVDAMGHQRTGTLHFSSRGVTTRFDVANTIAEMLGFRGRIEGVGSAQFPLAAPRPYSEGMESIYFPADAMGFAPGSWKDDLEAYISLFKS